MASLHEDLESRLIHTGRMLSSPPSATAPLLSLLDRTQLLLSRVDQSPPSSTLFALYPASQALVADHLTSHPDIDVRVAVTSCLSEVMRITAPDAPYSDDFLKVVFKLIVEAFQGLDDMSSRSFANRVSVLETAAKVRYCVVMLDLQLDHLILDMFRSFLNTIRPYNAEVITLMEAVMTVVLDGCESESQILPELVCCLLDCVAQDNEGVLPITRRLAEKVISNCAGKVKSLVKSQSDRRGTRGQQQEASISALESMSNMMKVVEIREAKAKEAKEEASKAGQDFLSKLEELTKMMKHENEADDVNAGKIYAEKAILATGAQELLSRFLSLSKERNESSVIINEIHRSLEARLAAAEKELAVAEQEKLDKEAWAHKLLKGQQLLMKNMVERPGTLKQEEENAKFRELLIEGGRIVDKLVEASVANYSVLPLEERVGDKSLNRQTEIGR